MKNEPAPYLSTDHLSPFVLLDLSLDASAIRAAVRARYNDKRAFINKYTGEARRYWHRQILRECVKGVFDVATRERHSIIHQRAQALIEYTADEQKRVDAARDAMNACSVTASGNSAFRVHSATAKAISREVYQRAYAQVIEAAKQAAPARRAA